MEKHKQWSLSPPPKMLTTFKLSFMNPCREMSTTFTSYVSAYFYQVKSLTFKSVYKMSVKDKNGFNAIWVKFMCEENLVGDPHLPFEAKASSHLLKE